MKNENRLEGIELFRVIAAFSIILVHTAPFGMMGNNYFTKLIHIFVTQICRFAVPFFFIVSGYFYAEKINNNRSTFVVTYYYVSRIIMLYGAWFLIYSFLPCDIEKIQKFGISWLIQENINIVIKRGITSLIVGPPSGYHLWFLPSLVSCVLLTFVYVRLKFENLMLPSAIIMYVFAVLSGSYSQTEYGIKTGFYPRFGPLMGWLFFVTGYILSKFSQKILNRMNFIFAVNILIFGIIVHFGEVVILNVSYGIGSTVHEFLFGTIFMGLGAFLVAYKIDAKLNVSKFTKFSKHTTDIFIAHVFLVNLTQYIVKMNGNFLICIIYPGFIFYFSIIISKGLEHLRLFVKSHKSCISSN